MSDTSTPPNGDPSPAPAPDPEKKFTQDDLSRVGTRQKEEGERAAAKKIADDLGMSIEEAKALISAQRAKDDAEKSALEKLQSDYDKLKSSSEKETSDSKATNHADRVKVRLLLAGVPLPDEADKKADALADLAGFIRVDEGAADDKIDEAIEGLKEKFPQLFETPTPPTGGGTPSSLPASGNPTKPPVGKSALEQGKERAAQQLAQRGITSSS